MSDNYEKKVENPKNDPNYRERELPKGAVRPK